MKCTTAMIWCSWFLNIKIYGGVKKMLKTFKGFCKAMISDDNGNYSSVRLMSVIALIIASYATSKITDPGVDVISAWLVAAFCPKVLQKIVEKWADTKMAKSVEPKIEKVVKEID